MQEIKQESNHFWSPAWLDHLHISDFDYAGILLPVFISL